MSFDWTSLPAARVRGGLLGLWAITFLATGSMVLGGSLTWRAQQWSARIPEGVRYYVLVRSGEGAGVRAVIEREPRARIVAEHRAGKILARAGQPEIGPDHLTVLEMLLASGAGVPPGFLDRVRGTSGVVDLIDLTAGTPAPPTAGAVARLSLEGLALVVLGLVILVAAILGGARWLGQACREEIGARVLLGRETRALSGPLAVLVGGTALAGILPAIGGLAAWRGGGAIAPAGLAYGGAVLVGGTLALAWLGARRAVVHAARGTIVLAMILSAVLGRAEPAWPSPPSGGGLVRVGDILRALSREVSVCRRARHVARKGLAATERRGIAAAAAGDDIRLRIAAAKRAVDGAALAVEEARCDRLEQERAQMREALHSTRLRGPAIVPRRQPVDGAVEISYDDAGQRRGTAEFRNGVGLRTRAGEPVRATAPGRVAYVGEVPGPGPVVVVDHGRRTYSVYARIARSLVTVGEEVDAGQAVAWARPGLLYFAIRRHGVAVDPLGWVADAPDRSSGEPGSGGTSVTSWR